MMRFGLTIGAAMILSTSQAMADSQELMFCAFQDSSKLVSISLENKREVLFRYGHLNEMSHLIMSQSVADIGYQPWPGVGDTIWETITFYKGETTYTIVMGAERKINPEQYGSIIVTRAGEEVNNLICIPNSVSFSTDNALYEAKIAAGLCFDPSNEGGWTHCD